MRDAKARALHDVSFEVTSGEFFTLLGPSGCGKSTTLRCIAGLERPDRGTVQIADRVVTSRKTFVPPNKRRIGMVFQSYAIWPHMSVFENVAFPLRQHREYRDRARLREAVLDALRVVQMEPYADRDAPYLSGGQQQRVALARAIIGRPDLLLLDEPLSNLDARLRIEMRDELRRICKQIGITTLYVTHDQSEALALSDRIAVLHAGRVLQVGSPTDIYRRPASRSVASFVGSSNFIDAVVLSPVEVNGEASVQTELGVLAACASKRFSAGERATLMLRPEILRHAPPGKDRDGWSHISGTMRRTVFVGDTIECTVGAAGSELAVRLPSYESVAEGDAIRLRFRPDWAWVLSEEAATASS